MIRGRRIVERDTVYSEIKGISLESSRLRVLKINILRRNESFINRKGGKLTFKGVSKKHKNRRAD